MYDVLYLDPANRCKVVGSSLSRESAAGLAQAEARRRGIGRMFLSGSAAIPRGNAVLVIRSGP
jgi:hypothetical protein